MRLGLDHQKGAGRAEREAGMSLARPDRRELVLEVEVAELVEHQQVLALAVMRTADQRDVALAGGDPRQRDPRRVDAGGFLAHEGARRAGDAVHDGDIAGQQVGELRQEQRRAQIVHQPFVEEAGRGVALGLGVQNGGVDREIALAAAGGDDHVHPPEDFLVALDAGGIQREPGGIGADALPGFHLALIALFRDLGVEIDRRPGMHDVGRKRLLVDVDAPRVERVPIRVQPFAERGGEADAGDPDFRRSGFEDFVSVMAEEPVAESRYAWPSASMCPRKSGLGKGMWLKVIVALHLSLPPTRTFASVMA